MSDTRSEDRTAGFGVCGCDVPPKGEQNSGRSHLPQGGQCDPETPKPAEPATTEGHRPGALDWFVTLLAAVGSGNAGKPSTGREGEHPRMWQCPAHRDGSPSLSVCAGGDGRVLVHCHGGCEFSAVLKVLKLPAGYLRKPPPVTPATYAATFVPTIEFPPVEVKGGHPASRGMRFEAEHPYGDRWWLLRYRHPVTGAKDVSWECLNPDGQRVPGLLGTPVRDLPLYRERDIRTGVAADEPVVLVESESSVDALRGVYATTWAGGASAVPVERIGALLGGYRRLVVIPDNDQPGLRALARLRRAGLTPGVLVGYPGEDARDIHRRLGRDGFRAAVERAAYRHSPAFLNQGGAG